LKRFLFGVGTALLLLSGEARAEIAKDTIKIGVLTDMSGLYSDLSGAGAVEAANLAVADFGGALNGKKIEVISADHQNKPDVANGSTRTGSI
jgi:branched-chain amino acid transport system substrate-binding protein